MSTSNDVVATEDQVSADLLSELAGIVAQIREASTVWYVTSEYCPDNGRAFSIPKRGEIPAFWAMHPNTLEKFLAEVPSFMVARPLSEYTPQYAIEIPQTITDFDYRRVGDVSAINHRRQTGRRS